MSLDSGGHNWDVPKELRFPMSPVGILRKRQALKRELAKQPNLRSIKIAILGGSTTADVKSMLEIFLLVQRIEPVFYESAYNAYYEEVLFDHPDLRNFKPDVVFVHTTWHNVSKFPSLKASEAEVKNLLQLEMARLEAFWTKIHVGLGAIIIQNNFDLPRLRSVGSLDAREIFGRINFLERLNLEFAGYANTHPSFFINDIHYLSARVGLTEWFDYSYWYNYHMATSPVAAVSIGKSVSSIINAALGMGKKCLVLDLDNTVWGGIIGDDGLQNLILGRDHPVGEAFVDFQKYLRDLQKRGILLAVCSKNDPERAKEGFTHPDMVLRLEDFTAFKANWDPKPANIREIAAELNIGLDSIVFVDDNPVERAIVHAQLPEVSVPDIGSDVSLFAEALEHEGYFEPARIVQDDLDRATYYRANEGRTADQARFGTYADFLASLEMKADIGPFVPVYLERITQLINKTNQFNLTTKRYTGAEVEAIAVDPTYLTLYGRLCDRFGDNGLVSIIIGRHVAGDILEIDLWVMSCRVLKREMELAMFDALIEQCQSRGVRKVVGVYIPSNKNKMVSDFYATLGFERVPNGFSERALWNYDVASKYRPKTKHIVRTPEALMV